jgi:hypothetical protein
VASDAPKGREPSPADDQEFSSEIAGADTDTAKPPPTNLTELANLLAAAIARDRAGHPGGLPTNSELSSLANLIAAGGGQRTRVPAFKDGLSALSYTRPLPRPSAETLPEPVGLLHERDDDEPMPIPSTWRQPEPREEDRWFRQQMGAALLGLVAGLMIVVPTVLWLSGWLGPRTKGTTDALAAVSGEARSGPGRAVAEVKTVKVQVQALDRPTETAAQFVAGSVEPKLVAEPQPANRSSAAAVAKLAEPSAAEARAVEAREAREAEARAAEARAAEARAAEIKAQEARAAEARAAEIRAQEARAAEARAAAIKAEEARAAEARAAEKRAAEARAAEARAAEVRLAEAKAAEMKRAEARAQLESLLVQARRRASGGDVPGAREMLAAADDGEKGPLSFALAETYDPNMLAAWGARGVVADVARATALYRKALSLGVAQAQNRLEALK